MVQFAAGTGKNMRCRADQIFAASNRVITLSRSISQFTGGFMEMSEKLVELKHAVASFDRLNRGMGAGES